MRIVFSIVVLFIYSLGAARAAVINEPETENTDIQILSAKIGDSISGDRDGCHHIQVRAVMKKAALDSPVFQGAGFYSNFFIEGSSNPYFAKAQLQGKNPVPATLKENDEPAVIFDFEGVGYCWEGDMSSSEYQSLVFKPFALYSVKGNDGNDHIYKKWATGGNSLLGGQYIGFYNIVKDFDRSSDLLK
jgi:hypothetical protein